MGNVWGNVRYYWPSTHDISSNILSNICKEFRNPKHSIQDTAERAQRTMRIGRILGEMFDGVVKQMKQFAKSSIAIICF